jgi:hypothetical protein
MKVLLNTLHEKAASRATLPGRRSERGYALMMVVFFVTLLLIASMAAAPSILQQGKREKEQEMIWRGQQYVRGVKLYYRKMGRFPTSVDDLTKPKVGSLRFMRQAYKDPMNVGDGSWRLIYVGPAGQLIGSLKPPQTLQIPGASTGLGTSASALASASAGQRSTGTGSSSFGSFGNSSGGATSSFGTPAGAGNNPQTATPPANGEGAAAAAGQPAAATDGSQPTAGDASGATGGDAMSTPQAITPTETPTIIGGNIIGVGSKISGRSVIVYDKAKNYHLFEFIWDPSKDATLAGQPVQNGPGLGQNIGTNPGSFGQQPGQAGQPGGANPNSAPNTPNTPNNAPPTTPPLDSNPTPAPEPEPQQ